MEKLYRFLKILIVILLIAVIVAGALVIGRRPAVEPAATIASEPAVSTAAATEARADLAPDFTMYDIDGNAVKLSDFRGKPVILNFWASWCGPCKAEMPDFEEAYRTYGQEVQFLIVNLTDGNSETVETASSFIADQGYTFPVYYDVAIEGAMAYRVYAIPVTYFLDAEGAVRAFNEGMISADVLESNITALLAQ